MSCTDATLTILSLPLPLPYDCDRSVLLMLLIMSKLCYEMQGTIASYYDLYNVHAPNYAHVQGSPASMPYHIKRMCNTTFFACIHTVHIVLYDHMLSCP
jgi:hypothetical protein